MAKRLRDKRGDPKRPHYRHRPAVGMAVAEIRPGDQDIALADRLYQLRIVRPRHPGLHQPDGRNASSNDGFNYP